METSFPLQQVLERYNVSDVRLAYRFEEMKSLHLNPDFIMVLLRMFEEEDCFPENDLNSFSLDIITDYIRLTHQYYISKKLPEMEQSIELLLQDYAGNHPLLTTLRDFYDRYRFHLKKHIEAEEKFVLPYISLLVELKQGKCDASKLSAFSNNYSLRKFIESHTDTEGDLQQVREIIQQYHPPATNQTPYRILLTQLQLFEKDLSVHAIIEDQVLIPRAIELEDSLLG